MVGVLRISRTILAEQVGSVAMGTAPASMATGTFGEDVRVGIGTDASGWESDDD